MIPAVPHQEFSIRFNHRQMLANMAAVCLASGCTNDKNLFTFPYDHRRRKQWVSFMLEEQEDFKSDVHKRPSLCVDHFEDEVIDNLIEVQAGLARVYRLNIDAVPTKHTANSKLVSAQAAIPSFTSKQSHPQSLTGKSPSTSATEKSRGSSSTEKGNKTKTSKSSVSRVAPQKEALRRPSTDPAAEEPPTKKNFNEKQSWLLKKNILEATCLQNVPTDLCIRLNITGSKNGSVSVQDINGCHYKRVVGMMCHMFRVLLAEQDLGVIAGRFDSPDDRLKRLTGLPQDHLNFLQKHPTFRDPQVKSRWPEFFNDYLMEKALVLRIKYNLVKEKENGKLLEPLWKPTLRLQKYTGLTQENAKVVKSTMPILG